MDLELVAYFKLFSFSRTEVHDSYKQLSSLIGIIYFSLATAQMKQRLC